MALPQLPEDIIRMEILMRLPIKSLQRFRSVCKLWKSLFSEPEYIKYHLNYTTQNPDNHNLIINKVVNEFDHTGTEIEDFHNDIALLSLSNLSETRMFDVPYSKPSSSHTRIQMLGSINGLVCIFLPKLRQFIIWNPATRLAKKITIPKPHFCGFFGFCWDELNNDFQVVTCHIHIIIASQGTVFRLYVYSCNSDSWSSLPNFGLPLSRPTSRVPCAIVNGVPYWNYSLICEEKPHVIKFEVRSKELKLLPELDVAVSGKHNFLIVNWKDCISVLVYKAWSSDCLVYVYSFDERCGIWSKVCNVGPITGHVRTLSACFKYGGEIVFDVHGRYMCYDHKTDKIKVLGKRLGQLQECFTYKASLVFLEGMKPLHHIFEV